MGSRGGETQPRPGCSDSWIEGRGAAWMDTLGSIGAERDAAILRRGFSCVSNSSAKAPALWLHRP